MATNVSFVCRASKANRLGTAPIEMTVTVDRKRTYVQMNLRAKPEDFKTAMSGAGNTEILEYVTALRKKVDSIIVDYTKKGIPVTAESIKSGFKRNLGGAYTLSNLFAEYDALLRPRIGKEMCIDTYERYQRAMKGFLEANSLEGLTPASEVTLRHCLAYQEWLLRRMDAATARGYLIRIRSIFRYAFETGKIPSNPAYGLKIQKGRKETVQYLTEQELEKLKGKKFGRRLEEVKDIFLFSCYTGISYGDIKELVPEDFKEYRGWTYVDKQRKKTGVRFMAIILPQAKEILEKYGGVLPVKSNQKTNEYLKEIGALCGIEKPLHFHMARHTAACTYLNFRPVIPAETIQRIFGWTNEKQLRHYAKLFAGTVFDDIERAFGGMQKYQDGSKASYLSEQELIDFQKLFE